MELATQQTNKRVRQSLRRIFPSIFSAKKNAIRKTPDLLTSSLLQVYTDTYLQDTTIGDYAPQKEGQPRSPPVYIVQFFEGNGAWNCLSCPQAPSYSTHIVSLSLSSMTRPRKPKTISGNSSAIEYITSSLISLSLVPQQPHASSKPFHGNSSIMENISSPSLSLSLSTRHSCAHSN